MSEIVSGAGEHAVFLDYSQEALDRAYDPRNWAPRVDESFAAIARANAVVRAERAFRTVAYGADASDTLDVFPTQRANAPILVHVHGGGWRQGGKEDVSYLAPAFVDAGAMFVAPEFAQIPEVRIPAMVAQLQRALRWIVENAAALGGDPRRIFVSGNSSGAHLAACLLTTDWAAHGLPADTIAGGCVLSGMYDLHPVMLSARRFYVQLDAGEIAEYSPIHRLDHLRAPLIVANGASESPEFQRQAAAFAEAAARAGKTVRHIVVDADHFTSGAQLADPASPLGSALFAQMGLATAPTA